MIIKELILFTISNLKTREARLLLLPILIVITILINYVWAKGPEQIDLKARYKITDATKPGVVFPHKLHQEKLKCIECHDSPEGKKLKFEIVNLKGINNDFHQKACWPCHKEMNVPKGTTCNTCHK